MGTRRARRPGRGQLARVRRAAPAAAARVAAGADGLHSCTATCGNGRASAYAPYPGYRPRRARWASTTASSCATSTCCAAARAPRPRSHLRADVPQLLPAGRALAVLRRAPRARRRLTREPAVSARGRPRSRRRRPASSARRGSPRARSIASKSAGAYLYEFSVWMRSPAAKRARRAADASPSARSSPRGASRCAPPPRRRSPTCANASRPEVAADQPVDVPQDVAVERRGHADRVVVRGVEAPPVLACVSTPISSPLPACASAVRDGWRRGNRGRVGGVEVADRRAGVEERDRKPGGEFVAEVEAPREVGDDADHLDCGKVRRQPVAAPRRGRPRAMSTAR